MTRPREIEIFRGIYLTAIGLDVLLGIAVALMMMTNAGLVTVFVDRSINALLPPHIVAEMALFHFLICFPCGVFGYLFPPYILIGFFTICLYIFLVDRVSNHRGYIAKWVLIAQFVLATAVFLGFLIEEALVFLSFVILPRGIALGFLFTKNSRAWLYPRKK